MPTPTPQRIKNAISALEGLRNWDRETNGPWDAHANANLRSSLDNAIAALQQLYAPDATDPAAIAEQLLANTMANEKNDVMLRVRAATMLLQHRAAVRENRPRR